MRTHGIVKCLIVDDREENLLALSALLRADDVEVLQAKSGGQALDLLLQHDVALAMLDVQMPEMDGFELAELMRGSPRTRHVPIIFITAGAHDQHRVFKGYDMGAVDFLHKPIDARIVRNKAGVFFQLYRQKQQLAQELKERTETLRLNEMFTAILGHDLRNPLNAVLTAAQLLEVRTADEGVKKTAGRMISSARRMSRLIEDMLDLARARLAGGIPLKRERVDLASLAQRVVQDCQQTTPDSRIELVTTGNLAGDWDGDRIAQVLANLIGNAVEHGTPGEAIEVRLDDTREGIALSVANAGTIPADILPHIFDPFRGGERPMGRSEGLGLGLFIVQQIVHAHEGRVEVESADGRTVFSAMIPRRIPEVVRL
jgi:signal transduction histidine kinase